MEYLARRGTYPSPSGRMLSSTETNWAWCGATPRGTPYGANCEGNAEYKQLIYDRYRQHLVATIILARPAASPPLTSNVPPPSPRCSPSRLSSPSWGATSPNPSVVISWRGHLPLPAPLPLPPHPTVPTSDACAQPRTGPHRPSTASDRIWPTYRSPAWSMRLRTRLRGSSAARD